METKLLCIVFCVTGFILGWMTRSFWQKTTTPTTKKSGGEKLLQKALTNKTDEEYKLVC
jgi:uncharacterized iron-regulated membrane protein